VSIKENTNERLQEIVEARQKLLQARGSFHKNSTYLPAAK
jgi:hypothetical protein